MTLDRPTAPATLDAQPGWADLAESVLAEAVRDLQAAAKALLDGGPTRLPKSLHGCSGGEGKRTALARLVLETLEWLESEESSLPVVAELLGVEVELVRREFARAVDVVRLRAVAEAVVAGMSRES